LSTIATIRSAADYDADDLAGVFGEFVPDVRPPRCVNRIGVDRTGLLVSIAMVAVTE
jgi:2-iminobutanoate/2-iminopropanoate deaminase